MSQRLKSEEVVVSAPFSFNGSALRIWKLTRKSDNLYVKWLLLVPLALMLVACAWMFVACWYLVFGIFVIPYRLIRRSSRKNKRDQLRHREVLETLRNEREQ